MREVDEAITRVLFQKIRELPPGQLRQLAEYVELIQGLADTVQPREETSPDQPDPTLVSYLQDHDVP